MDKKKIRVSVLSVFFFAFVSIFSSAHAEVQTKFETGAWEKIISNFKNDDPFISEKKKFSGDEITKLFKNEPIFLNNTSKFFSPDYYKQTLSPSKFIYFGEVKKNRPHGKGILCVSDPNIFIKPIFVPLYAGNFKNGVFSGYGVLFDKASNYYAEYISDLTSMTYGYLDTMGIVYQKYEGYFKDGKFHGEGHLMAVNEVVENDTATYLKDYVESNKKAIEILKLEQNSDLPYVTSNMPTLSTYIVYQGDFKKNLISGKGKFLSPDGDTVYEGKLKKGIYSGKGKLYYNTGQIKYDGVFKKGMYHGKGTLFNEDGSIEYKGKWKNGDLKG